MKTITLALTAMLLFLSATLHGQETNLLLEEQLEDRWDEYLEEEGEKWLKELEAQMYGPF